VSQRAAALAARFVSLNEGLIAALEALPPEQWRSVQPAERWPLGVVACHTAAGYGLSVGRMRQMLAGEPVDRIDDPDAYNAGKAAEYATVENDEAPQRLRREGPAAAAFVRALTDAQLDSTAFVTAKGNAVPIEMYVTHGLIGHLEAHGASLLAALGR
jgi:hypothetical protein